MVPAQLCSEWPWLRYWSPVQIFYYHRINSLRQKLYCRTYCKHYAGEYTSFTRGQKVDQLSMVVVTAICNEVTEDKHTKHCVESMH